MKEIIHKIPELFDYISDHDIQDFFDTTLIMIEKLSIQSIERESLNKAIASFFFKEPNVSDLF